MHDVRREFAAEVSVFHLKKHNQTLAMNVGWPPEWEIQRRRYQMCRALAYLHALGICHRDIKPQNLLVDGKTHVLKFCDFGSAIVEKWHLPN